MGLPNNSTSSPPSSKVSSLELHRIIEASNNLNAVTRLAQYAVHYKNLGWCPVVLDAHTGIDQKLDFGQPQSSWLNLLMDLALRKTRICLATRLEPDFSLFVLKVNAAFGKSFLSDLGDWRSPCVARAGDIWEHHFLLLPPDWYFSPDHYDADTDAPLSVIGTGGVVAVPPSVDPACHETWRWLQPPWENSPWYPLPRLLLLLEEAGFIARDSPKSAAGPAGPRQASATPGTAAAPVANSALLGPESATTPQRQENLRDELKFLANLTAELEEQVDRMERQHAAPSDGAAPAAHFESEDLQKLSRTLEQFLLRNPSPSNEE